MLRTTLMLAVFAMITACAVVKINSDATDTVEHSGGPDDGRELANRACRKAGAVKAEVISSVSKEAPDAKEKGRFVTTFRCNY